METKEKIARIEKCIVDLQYHIDSTILQKPKSHKKGYTSKEIDAHTNYIFKKQQIAECKREIRLAKLKIKELSTKSN